MGLISNCFFDPSSIVSVLESGLWVHVIFLVRTWMAHRS